MVTKRQAHHSAAPPLSAEQQPSPSIDRAHCPLLNFFNLFGIRKKVPLSLLCPQTARTWQLKKTSFSKAHQPPCIRMHARPNLPKSTSAATNDRSSSPSSSHNLRRQIFTIRCGLSVLSARWSQPVGTLDPRCPSSSSPATAFGANMWGAGGWVLSAARPIHAEPLEQTDIATSLYTVHLKN